MEMTKNILITGVSPGGIGYFCALGLKAQGHLVVGTVRSDEDEQALSEQGIATVRMEMLDYSSIDRGFAQALGLLNGRIDILFQNAGFGQAGFVEDLPVAAFEEQFKVNVFALHHLNTLLIPVMRAQGQGRIIIHSSVLGFVAMACRGAYVATKFALEGMVQAMRIEMQGSGVEVAMLNTGPVVSNFRRNASKALFKHVDLTQGPNTDRYQSLVLPRLEALEDDSHANYGPETVFKALSHAVNSPRLRTHYYITPPTKLLFWLKKILPTRTLDALLRRAG